MTETLTWTTSKGSSIEVTIREYAGRARAEARINGALEIETGLRPVSREVTASIGVTACIGRVGLTAEREAAVRALMTRVQAEIDATPQARRAALSVERGQLADRIGYLVDAAHEDGVARVEQMSATGVAPKALRDWAAEEAVARAALAAFDAAHPEIVAALEAERAVRAAQFLAAD